MKINVRNLRGRNLGFSGVFIIIVGMFFIMTSLSTKNSIAEIQKMIPDEAEWYEAPVTEVVSVEEDSIRKKRNGKYRYVTVYDCDFIVEYEINGETYQSEQSFNERSTPIKEGDLYYVKVVESDPERVYSLSTSNSDELRGGSFLNSFVLVGGVTVVIGVIVTISSFVSSKKQKNEE